MAKTMSLQVPGAGLRGAEVNEKLLSRQELKVALEESCDTCVPWAARVVWHLSHLIICIYGALSLACVACEQPSIGRSLKQAQMMPAQAGRCCVVSLPASSSSDVGARRCQPLVAGAREPTEAACLRSAWRTECRGVSGCFGRLQEILSHC